MRASISTESVEFWSGSFFIGDDVDSTRRGAYRREQAGLFGLFQACFPQLHKRIDADNLRHLMGSLIVSGVAPAPDCGFSQKSRLVIATYQRKFEDDQDYY